MTTRQHKVHTQLGRTAVPIFAANDRMNQVLIDYPNALVSNLLLNQSGCIVGNESVSNFWAILIGGSGPDFSPDLSPVDLLDVAFPNSTMSEPGVEFTRAWRSASAQIAPSLASSTAFC